MTALLDGRVTYELRAEFWSTAESDPAATGRTARFAKTRRAMPKVAYSSTLLEEPWNGRIERKVVPAEVRAMRDAAERDLALGGAELAATFLRDGLVDEPWIDVHPVLGGAGRRPFEPSDPPAPLHLVTSQDFGNGVALLRCSVPKR